MNAYIQLTRPVNLLIALFSVFAGGLLTGTVEPLAGLLAACASAMLVMAGANAINDCFDIEIDRINKPSRPLPAGRLSLKGARNFALGLFAAGIAVSLFINIATVITAVTASVVLYWYSARFKRMMILGNLTVGVITGMAFVYGGMAVGGGSLSLLVGLFAMFFHWGREIIKDIEDAAGDGAQGLRTLPLVRGTRTALVHASAVLVILIVLTLVPLGTGWFSPLYFAVVIPGVDLFMIWVIAAIWKNQESRHLHRIALLMKADMLVGLAAVFLGRLT
ncbi:geranylgeranylglycerol-phosphate geranylgeranyltransferase [bacterium]|nr:geranylgeranylglycerol-phosphate geranylgeranyltransferase [bacterium]